MASKTTENRPYKFGAQDRREFIVKDSETSLICINDEVGNPAFVGRAKIGVDVAEAMWQIMHIDWDSNAAVTRVTWPQNTAGNASGEFEFVWNADTDLTVTDVSNANPAVVTVTAIGTVVNGDFIVIQDVVGMTEVNYDGSNLYTVAGIAGNTFELSGIDSSLYAAYTSGGTVIFGNVVNLTYS